MPDGTKLGEAKLRGVESSGMILAEDEVGLGEDHAGSWCCDDDAPPGHAAGRGAPDRGRGARARDHARTGPTAWRVYGVAREVHAITAAPLAADPTDEDAEPAGDGAPSDSCRVEIDPEICLRFTVRVFEDVKIGPSPLWLKARLTRGRPAADQQRRRHHELRDAR